MNEYRVEEKLKAVLIQDMRDNPDKLYYVAAATLDRKGSIIAIGLNSYIKTHPLMLRYGNNPYKKYLHAEIAALAKTHTQAHAIVIVRWTRGSTYRMAKPCCVCEEALKHSGIKHVYYTNKNGALILHKM